MRLLLCVLALVFSLFPYTQILDLETYTQPYALIFSALAAGASYAIVIQQFPRAELSILAGLVVTGIVIFLLTCMPNPSPQELKYLLIYVSPIAFALAAFAIATTNPGLADRVIVFAAVTWMGVGAVQFFIAPDFGAQFVGNFGEAAEVVVESGRGVLGLAPEPTHFGFHMIIMAVALVLVGGRNVLSIVCLLTTVLVARSSSAMLALAIGGLIYIVFFTRRARLLLLAIIPASFGLGAILESGVLPSDVRAVQLLNNFYSDPWYFFTSDTSTNARLGGIYIGVKEIINNATLPAGMAHETWRQSMGPIMARHPWLLMLSEAGIPSGILIVVYQAGIFGLVLVVAIIRRMLSGLHSQFETFLLCVVVVVFFSQYMISTPGFGMILGLLIARQQKLGVAQRAPAPLQWRPARQQLAA